MSVKKFLNFFPWIYLLEDYEGYSMIYDLSRKKSFKLSAKETKILQRYFENPKNAFPRSKSIIHKLLQLNLAFLSEEKLYIDRVRIGSPLATYPSSPANVESLELVFNDECPYSEICPIIKENYLLSFPCQLCYLGEYCNRRIQATSVNFFDNQVEKAIQKIDPMVISVSGITLKRKSESLLNRIVRFVRYASQLRQIQINLPMYDAVYNCGLMRDFLRSIKQQCSNQDISFNITIFYDQREYFKDIFKNLKTNEVASKIGVTLVFDLRNTLEVTSLLREYVSIKYLNILLAPYISSSINFNQVEKGLSGLKDLFSQWFYPPDVYYFMKSAYSNEIPCMSSHLLLDFDLNISNCRGYWLKGAKSKFSRVALRSCYSNWHWRYSELCSRCMLKAGCFACQTWINPL